MACLCACMVTVVCRVLCNTSNKKSVQQCPRAVDRRQGAARQWTGFNARCVACVVCELLITPEPSTTVVVVVVVVIVDDGRLA